MNSYVILAKADTFLAVNMLDEHSGSEIRSLQEQEFSIVCDRVDAASSEQAILDWQAKHESTLYSPTTVKSASAASYDSARSVASTVGGIGWIIVLLGIILVIVGLSAVNTRFGFGFLQVMTAMAPGFAAMLSGIFLVALGHVVRATANNADHTSQIMKHLQSQ